MATEPKPATMEEVKMDLFEDDDEFEEFEINEGKSCAISFSLIISIAIHFALIWIKTLQNAILLFSYRSKSHAN